MKQMNKEELIEYFIAQLGDNYVLEKYFSIEEIRKRLNQNIKEVTYENEEGNIGGSYNCTTKTVNISFGKNASETVLRETIVHELIHALSWSECQDETYKTEKVGFLIQLTQIIDNRSGENGRSINEGITQLLTEQILGINTNVSIGYELEKDITRMVFGVFGKDRILDFYFSEARGQKELFKDLNNLLYHNSLVTKSSNSIDQNFRKVFDLSEQLTTMKTNSHGQLEEDQKEAYNKVREQLCTCINRWVNEVLKSLNQSDNAKRKQQILEAIVQFHDISMKLNTEELAGDLAKIIFESENIKNFGSKICLYKKLTKREQWYSQSGMDYTQTGKYIEEYCLANGIIDKSDFSKSGMLSCIFKCYGESLKNVYNRNIREILSNFSYTKVGEHYELHYHGISGSVTGGTNTIWFEKNGDYPQDIYGFSFFDGELRENGELPRKINKQEVERIKEQIQKISAESDKEFTRVMVLGKDVIMYYQGEGNWIDDNRIVYSIDDNGNLVPAEEEHRRLTDDIEEDKIDRGADRVWKSLIGLDIKSAASMLDSYLELEHQNIALEDMLEIIREVHNYQELKEVLLGKMQKFYISEVDFPKHDMLMNMISFSEENKTDFNKFYYQKVGSHYELFYNANVDDVDKEKINRYLFLENVKYYNEDGKKIIPTQIGTRINEDGSISYYIYQNKDIDSDLLDKIKKLNENHGNKFSQIHIIGNDIRFEGMIDKKMISEVYSLNEKGELELTASGIPRRVIDDLSELDIQIMQETGMAGVTVSDMMEMADKLNPKEVQKTEIKEVVKSDQEEK